ncbi:hypothetical protein SDJN02_17798, partial [Cucurbita argyrosperma subsp. argyrosperma]
MLSRTGWMQYTTYIERNLIILENPRIIRTISVIRVELLLVYNVCIYWLRRASTVIVAEEGKQRVVADVFDDLQLAIEEDE